MSKDEGTVLYAPDGRKWTATTPEEVTNLKARGYSETKPKTKNDTGSGNKS